MLVLGSVSLHKLSDAKSWWCHYCLYYCHLSRQGKNIRLMAFIHNYIHNFPWRIAFARSQTWCQPAKRGGSAGYNSNHSEQIQVDRQLDVLCLSDFTSLRNITSNNLLGLLSHHVHIHPYPSISYEISPPEVVSSPTPCWNLSFKDSLTKSTESHMKFWSIAKQSWWWIYPFFVNPVVWSLIQHGILIFPFMSKFDANSPMKNWRFVSVLDQTFHWRNHHCHLSTLDICFL